MDFSLWLSILFRFPIQVPTRIDSPQFFKPEKISQCCNMNVQNSDNSACFHALFPYTFSIQNRNYKVAGMNFCDSFSAAYIFVTYMIIPLYLLFCTTFPLHDFCLCNFYYQTQFMHLLLCILYLHNCNLALTFALQISQMYINFDAMSLTYVSIFINFSS